MANYIDTETGEEFTIIKHRIVIRNGEAINVDPANGKILKNPKNGNILTSIPPDNPGIPMHLKSNDMDTRVEMLKKRSQNHFKKDIKEKKYEMNKKLIKEFKGE